MYIINNLHDDGLIKSDSKLTNFVSKSIQWYDIKISS